MTDILQMMTDSNGPSSDDIRDWDNEYVVHPWHSMGTDDANHMIVSRADGIYIFDEQGKRYIDGPGGMWNTQIGYGRQEMADAISEQIMTLPFSTPWTSTSEPAALLAAKIAAEAPGEGAVVDWVPEIYSGETRFFGQIGTVLGRNWRIRRRIAPGIRKGVKTEQKLPKQDQTLQTCAEFRPPG